ncbi:MAG TPA: LacI family DNA-binding transcriptional regulator [Aggregatilinea sp.]|uniref:LacI family DNA-binding transcriptional regulator n=1 Tax=Aggregatilinea sp. TaxID=2806333 RepID=UPI002BD31033|nr:LacI family DNA-binding transcriptional regulator [Aggregatilinea sp.]HML24788.1 LacI family DNA-binding transcriptional regulator [Aggregatilinea sp.]
MPRKRQRATMKDVAKLAGVSVQTVSVAINNKETISDETRERVLAAIEEVGYRPYTVARSLRTGSTQTIALVVSDITNPFFASMANIVEDYAHASGYSLLLYNTHSDLEREKNYIRMATQRWIDGLLFVSTKDEMYGLEALQEANIPVVAIDRIPNNYDGPSVILDNMKTGRMVAEHLIDLGHKHFAHISGPMDLLLSRERLQGYQDVIQQHGLPPAISACGDDSWTAESGYQAMRSLLQASPRPTAVFAGNDRMAIGAMRAIIEAGLRIPDDISVVGIDDIELSSYQIIPLTTVRQSLVDVATIGIKILLDILSGQEPEQSQVVCEPRLVVRSSTGRPAASD